MFDIHLFAENASDSVTDSENGVKYGKCIFFKIIIICGAVFIFGSFFALCEVTHSDNSEIGLVVFEELRICGIGPNIHRLFRIKEPLVHFADAVVAIGMKHSFDKPGVFGKHAG